MIKDFGLYHFHNIIKREFDISVLNHSPQSQVVYSLGPEIFIILSRNVMAPNTCIYSNLACT